MATPLRRDISAQSSNWLKLVRSILEQTGDLTVEVTAKGDGFRLDGQLTLSTSTGDDSISASGMATWSG